MAQNLFEFSSKNEIRASFQAAQEFLAEVQEEIYKEARDKIRALAQEFLETLKQHIEDQLLTWQPLNEAYKQKKIREKLDPRILIATGEYVSSIFIEETLKQGILIISIMLPNKKHAKTGINLRFLSRVLEYGSISRNIPERPHWRPVAEMFIEEKQDFQKTINEIVSNVQKSLAR